jgi:hypothetical protein
MGIPPGIGEFCIDGWGIWLASVAAFSVLPETAINKDAHASSFIWTTILPTRVPEL